MLFIGCLYILRVFIQPYGKSQVLDFICFKMWYSLFGHIDIDLKFSGVFLSEHGAFQDHIIGNTLFTENGVQFYKERYIKQTLCFKLWIWQFRQTKELFSGVLWFLTLSQRDWYCLHTIGVGTKLGALTVLTCLNSIFHFLKYNQGR